VIAEHELRRTAGKAGIGVGQAEHEYVILCALDALGRMDALSRSFCLKGGTALRLLYFADWRHSVDLDFTVLPPFSPDELRPGLVGWLEQMGHLHGLQASLDTLHRANGAARARARVVGPLRHPTRLLLDVTLDELVLLSAQSRGVVTRLFTEPHPRVLTYTLEEILAEKLRSLLQRGKARDYYDVWRLLKEKSEGFDSRVVRRVLAIKCAHKGLPEPSAATLLAPEMLAEAGNYWTRDLAGQTPGADLPPWESVAAELSQLLVVFFSQ